MHGLRQQPGLFVEQRHAGFIAGSFEAENEHAATIGY
jgi:hypothetical protein